MSYVVAAYSSCGALLVAYVARTLRRERALRRAVAATEAIELTGRR